MTPKITDSDKVACAKKLIERAGLIAAKGPNDQTIQHNKDVLCAMCLEYLALKTVSMLAEAME